MSNKDRWNTQETPESADERERDRQARFERACEYGDYLRDELRDRMSHESEDEKRRNV